MAVFAPIFCLPRFFFVPLRCIWKRETAYRWQREGQSLREKGRNAQNGKNNTKTKLLT